MGNLYQLIGSQNLWVGCLVEIGGPYDRFGVIQSVIEKDFKLPNPCVVDGPRKFLQQKVNLYLIRGISSNTKTNTDVKLAMPVWGFSK